MGLETRNQCAHQLTELGTGKGTRGILGVNKQGLVLIVGGWATECKGQ